MKLTKPQYKALQMVSRGGVFLIQPHEATQSNMIIGGHKGVITRLINMKLIEVDWNNARFTNKPFILTETGKEKLEQGE